MCLYIFVHTHTHTHTHTYTTMQARVPSRFSCVRLFATIWTIACQVPLSMGFSSQKTLEWVVMPFSRESFQPRDRFCVSYVLSSALAGGFLTTSVT